MQICGTGFILPVIQQDLQSTAAQVQWVTNAFNITWGSFALVSGRLSDIYGLRRAYLLGLSWCALCLFVSAFMPVSSTSTKAYQNVAGLSVMRSLACPAASGIIASYFPQGRPRTLGFASLAGFGAVGAGLGWVLGGLLGDVK
jgi:MFS family permease